MMVTMMVKNSFLACMWSFFVQLLHQIHRWIFALVLGIVGCGFVIFSIIISQWPEPSQKKTDAIIIFTGEIEREQNALILYDRGLAPKLHISGRYLGFHDSKKSPITFDTAATTEKNAQFSYDWMVRNQIQSVRLVTADYHMPRCLIWAQQYWKNIEIIPHPIVISRYKGGRFLRIVLAEYGRYLASLMGFGYRVFHQKMSPFLCLPHP